MLLLFDGFKKYRGWMMKEEHVKINYICGVVSILFSSILFLLSQDLILIVVGLLGLECFIIALYGDKHFSTKVYGFLMLSVFIAIILILSYLYIVSLNNFGEHNRVIIVILAIMVGVLYVGINTGKIMFFGFRKISQFNKGSKLLGERKYKEALDYFDRISKKDHNNPLAWAGKASALQMLGKNEEALESVDNALNSKFQKKLNEVQTNLFNYLVFNTAGSIYFNLKNYEESLKYANKALKLHVKSNEYDLWNLKGIALNESGKSEEAIESFDKALSLKPQAAITLNNKADALNKLGKYEEAMENIDEALKKDPKIPALFLTKGEILINLNKCNKALKCFDKALEIDPDYEPAKKAREEILSL
jgi:tetratricopeptide (TPR) repeat protein